MATAWESKAAHRMRDVLAERGKAGEDRQALLDAILAIVADPAIPSAVHPDLRCRHPVLSGGQRFPTRGKSVTARARGAEGLERNPALADVFAVQQQVVWSSLV